MADPIPKLDTEEFIVPGYDPTGRTVRIYLQTPPALNQALDEIMKSGKFPFKSKDDAFRWCVLRGIKVLRSMGAYISILPILEMTVLLGSTQLKLKMFEEFFDKLDGAILELLTSGFQEQRARKLVKAIEELILCMPSSSDRGLYLGELRRRWGHLLTVPVEEITNGGKRLRDES